MSCICESRQALPNEGLVAEILGFDTAENEPFKVSESTRKSDGFCLQSLPHLVLRKLTDTVVNMASQARCALSAKRQQKTSHHLPRMHLFHTKIRADPRLASTVSAESCNPIQERCMLQHFSYQSGKIKNRRRMQKHTKSIRKSSSAVMTVPSTKQGG